METPSQQQPACCTSWTSNNVRSQARSLSTPKMREATASNSDSIDRRSPLDQSRHEKSLVEVCRAELMSSSQPQVCIMPVGDRRLNQHTRARLTVNGTPGKLHELRALSCGRSLVCKCFEHHSAAAPPQASTLSGTAQQFFPGKVPTTHPVKHCKTRRRPHLSKVRSFSKS